MTDVRQESLGAQLRECRSRFEQETPEDVCTLMDEQTGELKRSGAAETCLRVGDVAPDFELANGAGQSVRLNTLLGSGPVVLTFYRGSWCPYCSLELRAFQKALPDMQRLGAQLLSVSPQAPNHSSTTATQNDLTFEVLSDEGNCVAKRFGLVFKLSNDLRTLYEELGIDIPAHNGDTSFELPVPATFVIDGSGVIRYAFADPDYRKRAEPAEVMKILAQLQAESGGRT